MNLLSKLSGNSTFPRDCLFSSSSLVRVSLNNRRWYESALLSSISFASIICCRRLCQRSVLQRRLGSGVECTRSRLNLWISEDVTFCSFGCFFFFPLLSLLEVDLALSILAASLLFAKWSSNSLLMFILFTSPSFFFSSRALYNTADSSFSSVSLLLSKIAAEYPGTSFALDICQWLWLLFGDTLL